MPFDPTGSNTRPNIAATAGTLASISDGPAANSGDAACTTFGTTVTGGGGGGAEAAFVAQRHRVDAARLAH
jgi:hypothetical protein